MQVDAFHLPPGFDDEPRIEFAERDGIVLRTVRPSQERMQHICDALLHARTRLLATPVSRTIEAIDAAARRLRADEEPVRAEVLRTLTAFSGLHPAMARLVLDRATDDWLAPALHDLVRADLGGTDAIDAFLPRDRGVRSRAVASALGFHVFSGNVPGVSVTSIVRALLVRSTVIGKPALGEPFLAAAFTRLLAEADPLLGECCAILYWTGGDTVMEDAVLRRAGLVVHYGSADAIHQLRSRARPQARFVDHGPRLSFALIRPGAGDEAAARDLAAAVALFDQQGCVSPQVAWVLGTPAQAREFAARVAAELATMADVLPRGRLEAAEAAAIREARTRAEFRAIAGEDVALWEGENLSHTVIYDANPEVAGTCLNRTLLVKHVASVQQLVDSLRPVGSWLQTVGIAGFGDREAADVAAALGEAGVTRVAPVSAMPWPPATWHHDGRGPLIELVRWLDFED